ncbi:MAG: alkaline phosphatase family protein [Gemmatimonadaceae bacterium]
MLAARRALSGVLFSGVLLTGICLGGCARNTPPPPSGPTGAVAAATLPAHEFDHVIVVVLENENASTVDGVPEMAALARQGTLLRNYYAVAHPSYPNYLALISGKTFVGSDPRAQHDPVAYRALDFGDAQLLINAPTLVDRMEARGVSWNAFAEDYPETSSAPAQCDWIRSAGLYSRKHVPFLSFTGFHEHPAWCAHVRNLRWFRKDSLAAYTFITPNMVHDGHDAPLDSAVKWTSAFLRPVLADSALMRTTLVVITFDESANPLSEMLTGSQPNRIYTALIGGMVGTGAVSNTPYSHYSLLRTIELNFGLAPSLVPSGVDPISDVWKPLH